MREDDTYWDTQYQTYFQRVTGENKDEELSTTGSGFEDRYHDDKFSYLSANGSLAIFYRIPKKGTQTSTSPIPAEIGVFDNDDNFIGICDTREMKQYIVDGSKVTYIVVDFGAMLLQRLSSSVASPLVYKFTVRFLDPVAAVVKESAEKTRPGAGKGLGSTAVTATNVAVERKGFPGGPELVVCFDETTPMKFEIRGDDGSEDDRSSDDDDNDDDDDDDDDSNDGFENKKVKSKNADGNKE
eukprot:CAMPEP_0170079754 /NCGR_PEP_ID=MMETSP0019_2-20121128/16051_1 /TAXON_ID=98059 /ORGANISM="Dinobryon sp., Strain UTEXLB2267" /LENGTH=240 /DNA_ID=CAMNT_0010293359 /DNA_START=129 /DNA_END=851 /DNA_ORIENTATION=+